MSEPALSVWRTLIKQPLARDCSFQSSARRHLPAASGRIEQRSGSCIRGRLGEKGFKFFDLFTVQQQQIHKLRIQL